MAAVCIAVPGLPGRTFWTVVLFDTGILVVLFSVGRWTVRRMPPAPEAKGRPVSWGSALSWTTAAAGAFAATSLWLSRGVTLSWVR